MVTEKEKLMNNLLLAKSAGSIAIIVCMIAVFVAAMVGVDGTGRCTC